VDAGFDFIQEALLASGVPPRQLDSYRSRLEQLAERLGTSLPPDPLRRASGLFHKLWREKPHRYQPGADFRLHRALENQLRPEREEVGNCLGLTMLYTALAHCLGLGPHLGAVYLASSFVDRGPHVLSLLRTPQHNIDIEHVFPTGFDFRGHLDNPAREEWSEPDLVAETYVADGNFCFDARHLQGALEKYDRALELRPTSYKALVNRATVLAALGRVEEAAEAFVAADGTSPL
jgi:tetratricopeptide (TPR) repeat protein